MKTSDIQSMNLRCRSNNDGGYHTARHNKCVLSHLLNKDEIVRSSGNNSSSQNRLMRRHNMLLQVTDAACPKEPLSSHWFNSGTYSDDNLQGVITACPDEPLSHWFYSEASSDDWVLQIAHPTNEGLLQIAHPCNTRKEGLILQKTQKRYRT